MRIPPPRNRITPSQWETALLCNDGSHWLGASLESALRKMVFISKQFLYQPYQWVVGKCLVGKPQVQASPRGNNTPRDTAIPTSHWWGSRRWRHCGSSDQPCTVGMAQLDPSWGSTIRRHIRGNLCQPPALWCCHSDREDREFLNHKGISLTHCGIMTP